MILVTVGTQLAFPRLVAAMDAYAATTDEPVIAQVGPDPAAYPHLDVRPIFTPAEFEACFAQARIVVSHAGIGSLLTARRLGRPIVLVPRRHDLGEHRNDHQQATAAQVEGLPGVYVLRALEDLPDLLAGDLAPASEAPSPSRDELVAHLREFLNR